VCTQWSRAEALAQTTGPVRAVAFHSSRPLLAVASRNVPLSPLLVLTRVPFLFCRRCSSTTWTRKSGLCLASYRRCRRTLRRLPGGHLQRTASSSWAPSIRSHSALCTTNTRHGRTGVVLWTVDLTAADRGILCERVPVIKHIIVPQYRRSTRLADRSTCWCRSAERRTSRASHGTRVGGSLLLRQSWATPWWLQTSPRTRRSASPRTAATLPA